MRDCTLLQLCLHITSIILALIAIALFLYLKSYPKNMISVPSIAAWWCIFFSIGESIILGWKSRRLPRLSAWLLGLVEIATVALCVAGVAFSVPKKEQGANKWATGVPVVLAFAG